MCARSRVRSHVACMCVRVRVAAGGCQRWNFDALPPLRDLVGYYLPPFQAAVQVARVQSIMCAYNAVNGMPACGNDVFNNALLRGEWGWQGYIVRCV
jgi:hypothetical protein